MAARSTFRKAQLMNRIARILTIAAAAQLLWACASDPNAYKKHDDQFGYTGEFVAESVQANVGGVTFTGDKTISRQQLRNHCMRRIAELCIANGYDYYDVITAKNFSGTAHKPVTTWWGTTKDAYGNTYNRYRTHYEKIPTEGLAMAFDAYRGPKPSAKTRVRYDSAHTILNKYHGTRYKGRTLEDSGPLRCAACGETAEEIFAPEHCPSCGMNLFSTVLCPFCRETVGYTGEGPVTCPECSKVFCVACCPFCGGRHTLRNFLPFICAFCDQQTAPGILSGEEGFRCFHCDKFLGWPEELFGQYECAHCKGLFLVDRCPHCSAPHALLTALPYACQKCGAWVEYVSVSDDVLPCPHCGKVRDWPDAPSAVGLCTTTMKMAYLTHCRCCSAWLIQAEDRPFFCILCGSWTKVFRCPECRESVRGHPHDPPEECPGCGRDFE